MSTIYTFVVGTFLVGVAIVGMVGLLAHELRTADRRWEAEQARQEAADVAAWEAHVADALAAASPVPDYVPDWEDLP